MVIDAHPRDARAAAARCTAIGELRTEQLDIVPAQLRVRVTRRPRYACRACEGAVVVAEAPARPIDGGMATEALIAHVLISKFCDSLPLYRQAQMLARQGITIDRSTLANWVGRACWWLTPLYDLVVSTALSANKLFADDTTLPVLDPGRGRTKTGRLWCYAVDDRPWCGPAHPIAAYVYSEDRKGARPARHLARFGGVLQVDGYAGFKRLAGDRADESVQLAFCWAHMRRAFYEFHASTKSPLAAEVLARVGGALRDRGRDPRPSRRTPQRVRGARSRPIVEGLHGWLGEQLPRVSGASDLAKAMRYALRHWPGLIAFLRTAASRWTRTWSSARSGRSPLPARTRCSPDRWRRAPLGDRDDLDPDGEAERGGAHGLADRCAGAHRLWADQGPPTAQFVALVLAGPEQQCRWRDGMRSGSLIDTLTAIPRKDKAIRTGLIAIIMGIFAFRNEYSAFADHRGMGDRSAPHMCTATTACVDGAKLRTRGPPKTVCDK